ncbi:MAG: Carboxypeptidase regulatory-like protein [Gemmatimonadetes bacterium]|nr:Carboxypeptidase regulatory-like protein [Gemmatimonadota bacterium]
MNLTMKETDSTGWLCIRDLTQESETLSFLRPGYRRLVTVVHGATGQLVNREIRLVREIPPCCDLRGTWRIALRLATAEKTPSGGLQREVVGAVNLGSRYLAAQRGDNVDSLVSVVRGLHHVDFTPFFGGPVAHDVSTTIVAGGPDLLHEVEASIPKADSVLLTFIPRMSHGSLSLSGRIRGDTIRGTWQLNAFCCGSGGQFVMTRTGPPDSASNVDALTAPKTESRRAGDEAGSVPEGQVPDSRWQPELAVSPDGRLWLASGGLFVTDSLGGAWRRVLGGDDGPVLADELRIGVQMAFVGPDVLLVGLGGRFPTSGAPVLYRTENAGRSWTSVALEGASDVDAMQAVGSSIWILARSREDQSELFYQSSDSGRSWRARPVPKTLQDVTLMHRESATVAYVASSLRRGNRAFWRTIDSGVSWEPIPTPSEQGLQRLHDYDTRIEQVATLGRFLVVREHGRVFASASRPIRWRLLGDVEAIAGRPGCSHLFALVDSLRPAFFNSDLALEWRSDRRLPVAKGSYLEDPVSHCDVAYVAEGPGSIHGIRRNAMRVIRPPVVP